MPEYRRPKIEGGVFFFTVALVDRSSDLLVRHIDRLRRIYASVQERYPFETIAICVLPDHLHAVWSLPPEDANFSLRRNVIKSGFSRGLAGDERRQAGLPGASGEFGNVVIGSMPSATTRTWRATSITSISIPSSTDTCRGSAIGHTAASNDMSHVVCCRWIGVVTFVMRRGRSVSRRCARRKSAFAHPTNPRPTDPSRRRA
jgi:REP element-mobilizing transposase RayT